MSYLVLYFIILVEVMFKYIIYYFGLELPDNIALLVELAFNVALICLVVLFCFINVFGYLIALYFVQNKDFYKKYTKFKGVINYFNKSSRVMVIIEALIGFSGLIVLIYLGFFLYLPCIVCN